MTYKDAYMHAADVLAAEYLESHPEADDAEAYDATASMANDVACAKMYDRADALRDQWKERNFR